MGFAAALLAAICPAGPARAGASDWNQVLSPHFEVRHEAAFAPKGIVLELEKIHNRLRMDLSMFAPWMAKERVNIFIHESRESYVKGEFKPPPWSNGIAQFQAKRVITYDREPRDELLSVTAHELTHLFFESYWSGEKTAIPSWLNEGLAMLEENDTRTEPEKTGWYQAMALLDSKSITPFRRFVTIIPTKHLGNRRGAVTLWYVQAYSMVHFLYRGHSRLQFFNFSKLLREGKTLEEALWSVYRFHTLEKFQDAWAKWLGGPETAEKLRKGLAGRVPAQGSGTNGRGDRAQTGRPGGPGLKKVGFKDFGFGTLIPQ